jgi:MFS family permease
MRLTERLRETLVPFRGVFVNPNLRRLELAWAGSITGEWGYAVALSVFAYHAGGTTAVGVLMLVRMLSSAVVAPFSSILGDRHNRARVMIWTDLTRAAALAGAGLAALASAPAIVIYALAVVVAIVSTAFHPAQAALTPSLASTPEELTAANAVGSTIESVGTFAGPALGGLLLAATSIGVVFIVMAMLFLWSAFFVLRIRTEAMPALATAAEHPPFLHQATAGIRTIVKEPKVRLIVGIYGCQTLIAGAVRVFIVVMAFQLLHTGNAGVGFLNSATGIGGLLGAVATIIIVGRSRLATDFGVGVVLWGLPLVLIGIWPQEWLALLMLGVIGVANTVVDVAAFTLLQRAVPDEVLARVFGVLQSVLLGTIGIGSVLASVLVSALGARTALVVAGSFLPVVALLTYRRLLAIDREATGPPPERVRLLQGSAIFAPLPLATIEWLSSRLLPVHLEAGSTLFRQGEHGDRFYLIDQGELEVLIDGAPPKVEGPGGSLGEIALLRDIPRTATVRARTDADLYALERDDFLGAVTGHPGSAEAAEAVVGAHLGVATA